MDLHIFIALDLAANCPHYSRYYKKDTRITRHPLNQPASAEARLKQADRNFTGSGRRPALTPTGILSIIGFWRTTNSPGPSSLWDRSPGRLSSIIQELFGYVNHG